MPDRREVRVERKIGATGAAAVGQHERDIQVPTTTRENRAGGHGSALPKEQGVRDTANMLSIGQRRAAASPDKTRSVDADFPQATVSAHAHAERPRPLRGH